MRLIPILIVIAISIMLVSCGGGNGGNSTTSSKCSQTPTFGSSTFGNSCFK